MTATAHTDENAELAAPISAVGDSMTVAVWTLVSRATGVIRGIVVAAVLGATYFANTYQFTNSLPNLVFYGFLGGSLFSSLLIPALVRHLDSGDRRATERVAGGFFGIVLVAMLAAIPLAVLVAPFALNLGSEGVAAGDQARVGGLLVLMLMPQIALYGVVGTASAVMNARRRFALAAAAPALENVGTIVVLGLVFVLFPGTVEEPSIGALLLLGLGTTASVGVHAAAQWLGARHLGVRLRPLAGWHDPEVRAVVRSAVPALAQASLAALQLLVLLMLANRVAGGVVAFQLAMNFYFLPIALGATPVALSLAPRLSRMTSGPVFRDTFVRGLGFALFVAVPAAVGYVALATPLATAVSHGGFGTGAGIALIAASLTALSLGVAGETAFLVATYACYARKDTVTPLRAMVLQVVVCLGVAGVALTVEGPAVLTVLGLALSAGGVVSAAYLVGALLRHLPQGSASLVRPLCRIAVAAAAMAAPAAFTATVVARWTGGAIGALLGVVAATLVGAVVYLSGNALLRAPELMWIAGALPLPKLHRPKVALPTLHRPRVALPTLRRPRVALPTLRRPRVVRPTLRRPEIKPPQTGRPAIARLKVARPTVDAADVRANLKTALLNGGLLLGCLAVGALAGQAPVAAVGLLAVLGIGVWVYSRPAVAAYLIIALTPLTAGIDRGTLLPVLRPNEALAMLVGAALAVRWLLTVRTGDLRWPRLGRLDAALLALGVCSSFVPLLMMVARERTISGDDLQYATVLWKYVAIYVIVRCSVTTERQAYRCLVLSMGAASVVCAIGILQALGLFGVPDLLATLYAPFGVERTLAIGRGSSTLGLAAAVADLAIINLGIAVGLLLRGARHRGALAAVVVLCVFGILGAGEFSTVIGLVVAIVALTVVSRAYRMLGYAIPVALAAGVVMWPVIELRLLGFQSASGMPDSWIVRLRNLNTYFWPELAAHGNWVLGVRPSARVAASHEEFGWVWIESGYTWLLWGGGVPLLASYLYFVRATLRRAVAVVRRYDGAIAVAGMAIAGAVCADVVLMLFDPHLTYRGAADAMFALLALLRPLHGSTEASDLEGPA